MLEDDPGEAFVRLPENGTPFRGDLLSDTESDDETEDFVANEPHWSGIGEDGVAGPPKLDGETTSPDY